MSHLIVPLTLLFLLTPSFGQQPSAAPAKKSAPNKTESAEIAKSQGITVDGIISLVEARLSEDLVIWRLRQEGKAFDLSPEEMIKLKKAGASDGLITVMMDPKAVIKPVRLPQPVPIPVTPQSPTSQGVPPTIASAGVISGQVASTDTSSLPQNPGVYYRREAQMVRLESVQKSQARSSSMMKSMIPGVSLRIIAIITGPSAGLRITNGRPVFYVVRSQIEAQLVQQSTYGSDRPPEAQIVKLTPKNNQREIEVARAGGMAGNHGGYPQKSSTGMTVKKLSPTVYELTPVAELENGEYLLSFLFLTAEFEFGIRKSEISNANRASP